MVKGSGLLLNKYPPKFLIYILRNEDENICKSDVTDSTGTTYAHGVRILNQLVDEGYISTERKGRRDIVRLTEDGRKLAEELEELVELTGGFSE